MSRFLLDVSTVLALLDRRHEFHERAFAWARQFPDARWLTSPIVQNGVVRVASQSAYPSRIESAAVVRATLQAFCADARNEFCPDDVSLLDEAHVPRPDLLTAARVTDFYLVALARHHRARLATFDRRIPHDAFAGADDPVFVLPG